MNARQKVWQDLIALDDLEQGDATPVSLGPRELAVFDTTDGIFVAHARCTHGAANLCDGYFDGRHIECPLHQGLVRRPAPASPRLRPRGCR